MFLFVQTHSCKYVHETLAFSSLKKVYIKVTYFIFIMQIISFLYFEELIPKVTEYVFFYKYISETICISMFT